jgi:predicted nucleotidyltransferase
MIKSKEKEIVQRFKEKVTETLEDRLDRIVLFGSRARGDAEEDSDFDFLVTVKNSQADDKERVRQIAWELSLEYDTVITPLVIPRGNFVEEKYFYLHENIHKEGRVI